MKKKIEQKKDNVDLEVYPLEEAILRLQSALHLERKTTGFFLLFFGTIVILGRTLIPGLFSKSSITLFSFILIFLLSLIFDPIIKRQKSVKKANFLFFIHLLILTLFITLIVYDAGGVEWLGAIFYLFPIVWGNVTLPKTLGRVLTLFTAFSYSALVLLQYFNLIPYTALYNLPTPPHLSSWYVFSSIAFAFLTFYFLGMGANLFTDEFRKKVIELEKTKNALEEAKTVLEIKVRARTRELQELIERQEEIIKERTRELQEKIDEMEKFQKIAVGRELKIIELKDEIKKLKEELEKYKTKTN